MMIADRDWWRNPRTSSLFSRMSQRATKREQAVASATDQCGVRRDARGSSSFHVDGRSLVDELFKRLKNVDPEQGVDVFDVPESGL